MPTFQTGFTRPGTYVRQTSGQSAPALPPNFVAIFLGHGAASYVTTEDVVMGTGTDVVDATHAATSITAVTNKNTGVVYAASGSAGYAKSNTGTIFSIVWTGTGGTDKPLPGETYTVAYLATKNAVSDYLPQSFTSLQAQIDYSGTPAASVSAVMSGVYETNNVSLAAAIGVAQGMGQWYSLELDPVDETSGPTAGIIVSGSSPSTSVTSGATVNFSVNINGDGAQSISLTSNSTGADIAADIQAKVRLLTAVTPANQAAINGFTCTYGTTYTLTSGSTGIASTLAITEGTGTTAAALKITTGTRTSYTAGARYTALDLTVEAQMKTAVTQALVKLMLIEGYALVPCFPMVSSGINTSIISVVNAHIVSARSLIEQKWRVAFYGLQKSTDTGATPETKYITLAGVLGAGQVAKASVVIAPSTGVYSYGTTQFTLDGYGIAAAVAGILTNPTYTPGEPISGKQLVGFDSITDPFNNTQKALMGNAGVLMVDSELGTPAVIMDLTTDQTTAVNSQIKFTKAADYVSKSLRLILRRIYINTRSLGPSTLSAISATVRMVLQQMVWLGIINDFTGLSVTRNSIDSRQVDVSVEILLTPDVSWIFVSLGVSI